MSVVGDVENWDGLLDMGIQIGVVWMDIKESD